MLKILAPMAGYTDIAFREVATEKGADITVTEMVSAMALVYENKKTIDLLDISPKEKKVAVQIFGSDPDVMGEAARILNDYDFSYVDINMGCPAPKIVKNNSGSHLLSDPSLVYDIVKSVVKNSNKPVTAKVRKGIGGISSMKAIKNIEAAGATFVTVHGRTREEYYTGKADWDFIKEVKANVKIPVIGNGDVDSPEDAIEKINYSKVDGLAIGRGAIGNPYIFNQIEELIETGDYYKPSDKEKLLLMIDELERKISYKGEKLGILEMRKVYAEYFKGMKDSKEVRNKLNNLKDKEEILKTISDYIDKI
ncbi:MAG: tRNA dihydrouridine synthase DusB [Peptoniphilus sp.]|uniref:tRNA dihydrouridine synthase DusB n=1 Tax=Peptoniphilus sp. TaxID=1971214 RepID=UPI003991BA9C